MSDDWPDDDDAWDPRLSSPVLQPKTLEDVADLYGDVKDEPKVATGLIARKVAKLKTIRNSIYALQDVEKELKDEIAIYMLDHGLLVTDDGEELVSWKRAAPSDYFDTKAFKAEHENIYKLYVKQRDGSRRFLIK